MNVSVAVRLDGLLRSLRRAGHALAEAVERDRPRQVPDGRRDAAERLRGDLVERREERT